VQALAGFPDPPGQLGLDEHMDIFSNRADSQFVSGGQFKLVP
jgi:hypothetical protein